VYERLFRTAPTAAEAASMLLAFEGPALRAGAGERFLAEVAALLDREDLAPRERAAVRSARARVLARDPARFAEAAAAYRALLEAGDDETGAEARAFDALLGAQGAAGASDRRWLFAYRAERAASADRVPLLMTWAAAEEVL